MISERKKSRESTVLLVGVLLSAGLGVFFYFRTDVNTALATVAGLVGTTIALQVESLLRERRTDEELSRQQRLILRVEAVNWLPEQLEKMIESIHAIEQTYHETIVPDLVRRIFESFLAQMRNLQRGQFEVPIDDNWLIYALTKRASEVILATSVDAVDLAWWKSAAGQNYWRLNQEALRKGVRIRRIFIYHEWGPEHEALARSQSDASVDVLRVQYAQLPAALRLDMIIWDRHCGFQSRINAIGGEAIANSYAFAQQDLNIMIDQYNIIESCAESLPQRA
jgi:hypothetical protein